MYPFYILAMSVILEEALKLPAPERIQLADKLYASVDESTDYSFSLTPDQMAELDRRMAEHRANPESGIPWEVVRERLLNRS